jgi:hypothetical protein
MPKPKAKPGSEKPAPSTSAEIGAGIADAKWEKDGDREDQDYYHIPGAKNPDRANPPRLDGERLPKKPRG